METVLWTLGACFFIVILAAILEFEQRKKFNRFKEKIRGELASIYGAGKYFVSNSGSYIGFINTKGLMVFGKSFHNDHYDILGVRTENKSLTVEYKDIISMEVLVNDQSITTTNRGSQITGAAIGALALGGVGALIGGLSGSSTTKKSIHFINAKIFVDNDVSPVLSFPVLERKDMNKTYEPNSQDVLEAIQVADELDARVKIAIRRSLPATDRPHEREPLFE